MGIKGDKLSQESVFAAELLIEKLNPLAEVSSKKMFGGHGLFHDGNMFGLIDSKGKAFMKADDKTRPAFEAKGAVQHSRMLYFSIPLDVYQNGDELIKWAKKAIAASK